MHRRWNGAFSAASPLEITARGEEGGREPDLCRRRALKAGGADDARGVREDHEGLLGGLLRADALRILSLDGFVERSHGDAEGWAKAPVCELESAVGAAAGQDGSGSGAGGGDDCLQCRDGGEVVHVVPMAPMATAPSSGSELGGDRGELWRAIPSTEVELRPGRGSAFDDGVHQVSESMRPVTWSRGEGYFMDWDFWTFVETAVASIAKSYGITRRMG